MADGSTFILTHGYIKSIFKTKKPLENNMSVC